MLDLYGGHAVAALGYGHPRWVEALARASAARCVQSNALPLEVRRRAATRLAEFCGLGLARVFFVNSGAEANENALRLALKVTGGTKVIAMERSFHGRTAAAGAVTWGAQQKWYGFPRTPFDVAFMPRDIDELGTARSTTTAAVIIEPVQGVAGAFDLPTEFLRAALRCSENGSVLIFDEVQCGIGRTGYPFGAQHVRRRARHLHSREGLGAGFPCGAC